MPKTRRSPENLPKNQFEEELFNIYKNIKKEVLAKNRNNKVYFKFFSHVERWKKLTFGAVILFCIFAVIILTIGVRLRLPESYLKPIIALMNLAIFSEICWIVMLFAEEVNKSKQRKLDSLEEFWEEILEFHRKNILRIVHLYPANEQIFDHAFALKVVKKALVRKAAQIESIGKKNDSYLPFFAIIFAVIVIIIFESFGWNFYRALGIAAISTWVLYALKLLSSSDSPKLVLCKQCTSIVEAMQLVNNFKVNQNLTHSNEINSSKPQQSVSALPDEDNKSASFLEATQEFAGCLEGGPENLSVNKQYLEDLGKE